MTYLKTDIIPQYCFSSFRAFEEGESHVNRICNEDVIVFVLDGILRFKENETEVEVCKNQYYIQKAGLKQSSNKPSEKPKYFYIHFHGEIGNGKIGIPIKGAFSPEKYRMYFDELDRLNNILNSHLKSTVVFLQIIEKLENQYRMNSLQNNIADKILEILICEKSENITVNDIGKRLSYSQNYIIKVFKHKFSLTPHQYLTKLRVESARKLLLSSDKSYQEISGECGFSEYSVFFKSFKKEYGISPKEFADIHRIPQP